MFRVWITAVVFRTSLALSLRALVVKCFFLTFLSLNIYFYTLNSTPKRAPIHLPSPLIVQETNARPRRSLEVFSHLGSCVRELESRVWRRCGEVGVVWF